VRAHQIVEAEIQGDRGLPPGTAKSFLKQVGKKEEPDDPFAWDNFNPDAEIGSDSLRPWIEFIGNGTRPIKVANKWFPGQRGRISAVKNIRGYLWNKLTAMDLRLQGNIARAIQYEDICQRIYDRLPDYACW
jgi:hypothetical protein